MQNIFILVFIALICMLPAISRAQPGNEVTTNIDSTAIENRNGALGLPGDNLNLFAVMKLFRESETIELFEKNLNDEHSDFNNLDLNGDGQIDYISVIYNFDGNLHTIILSVALNETEYQDIATIYVDKDANNQVRIQLIGNEALYGKDYIIEPDYQENGPINRPGIEVSQNHEKMGLIQSIGNNGELKYYDGYSFTSKLHMVTETLQKKVMMRSEIYLYFSFKTPILGLETMQFDQGKTSSTVSTVVMDGENKCSIILMDLNGKKMGVISAMPDAPAKKTQNTGKPDQLFTPGFSKTGNYRMIAGYKCDEYSFVNPEKKLKGKVWFTKDTNLLIDQHTLKKTSLGAFYGYSGFEGGIVLASETYDVTGKLTLKTETIEIVPNFNHFISLKDYTLMQVNSNQRELGI